MTDAKYPLRGWMIALLLNLPFVPVSAQKLPAILTATRYEKGVYKDFSEFLHNSPSITNDFEIMPLSGERRIEKGIADFKLIMLDSAVRRRDAKKFWGACDGESIYVNEMGYDGPFRFKKIHGIGRYCYFNGSAPVNYAPIAATGGGLIGGAITGAAIGATNPHVPYILNINNGKFFILDKKLLRIILKQDKELLTRYEAAQRKNKDEVLVSYIKEYNSRHESEAYVEGLDPIQIVFYRRDKKEVSSPVTINMGDSTLLELARYDVRKHFSTSARFSYCINDECGEIALAKKRVNYIECVLNRKSGKPELIAIDHNEGEFHAKKIEAEMVKEEK
jgi:hypothetical protein